MHVKEMAKLLLYFPNSCSKIKKFDYLEEKKINCTYRKKFFHAFLRKRALYPH